MPTFADSRLPKPHSWDEFEKIVCSIAKIRWDSADFARHGRQGQEQNSVDVFGQDKNGAWIGLQCKNTIAGVSEKTIQAEVEEAERFVPSLSKLYIATTADTDAKTQAFVRSLSERRRAEGKFPVSILFWGDLWDELTRDQARLFQHYPQLKPQVDVSARKNTHDQRLFELFMHELPFEPSMRLLREQDFGAPFQHARIRPLFSFVDTWDTPEHEFMDAQLQAALSRFYEEAKEMATCIALRTVPVGSGEMRSVYSDQQRARGPRSEHVIREAKEMNEAASRFFPKYEEFLRLCRSKLST